LRHQRLGGGGGGGVGGGGGGGGGGAKRSATWPSSGGPTTTVSRCTPRYATRRPSRRRSNPRHATPSGCSAPSRSKVAPNSPRPPCDTAPDAVACAGHARHNRAQAGGGPPASVQEAAVPNGARSCCGERMLAQAARRCRRRRRRDQIGARGGAYASAHSIEVRSARRPSTHTSWSSSSST